jgi:hypothetical protein
MLKDNTRSGYGMVFRKIRINVNTDQVQKIEAYCHIKDMDAADQRDFLERNMKNLSTPDDRARVGADFRNYCQQKWLKLDELFDEHRVFMNEELRDFLNYSDRGEDDYTWDEVTANGSGWTEIPSVGAQFHQTKVTGGDITVIIINSINLERTDVDLNNRLNAKFVRADGREAVFKYVDKNIKVLVTDYPDKGTFNYYPGSGDGLGAQIDLLAASIPNRAHDKYDVKPYYDIWPESDVIKRWNSFGGVFMGNSKYWDYEQGGTYSL